MGTETQARRQGLGTETGTGIEGLRKGQRNTDSESGTWTWSGTERQGQDHRDWDERHEQVQRLRDINTDRVIGTERQKWGQSHTNVIYNAYQLEMLHSN